MYINSKSSRKLFNIYKYILDYNYNQSNPKFFPSNNLTIGQGKAFLHLVQFIKSNPNSSYYTYKCIYIYIHPILSIKWKLNLHLHFPLFIQNFINQKKHKLLKIFSLQSAIYILSYIYTCTFNNLISAFLNTKLNHYLNH